MTYIQPLTTLVLAFGVIALFRCRDKWGRAPLACAVVGLFVISWPPLEWLFSRPLEFRYQKRAVPADPADAIVVLSSNVGPSRYGRPGMPDRETYERCRYAAWLYKRWRQVPVLACGGRARVKDAPFAITMRDLLQDGGVPDSVIWMEERSHSTYDNAAYGSVILKQRGIRAIALVVEARSMRRAAACFRRQGLVVVPAPSSFDEKPERLEDFLPDWRAIGRNEASLHEAIGLAWYKLRGWI